MESIGITEIHSILLDILLSIDQFCRERHLWYSLSGGTLLGAIRHQGFIPWDDDADIVMPRKDYEYFIRHYSHPVYECITNKTKGEYFFHGAYAKVNHPATTPILVNNKSRYGISVDIFPIDTLPDDVSSALKQVKQLVLIRKIKNRKTRCFAWSIKNVFAAIIPFSLLDSLESAILQRYNGQMSNHCGALSGGYGIKERQSICVFETTEDRLFEGHMFMIIAAYDPYLTSLYCDYMILPPKSNRIPHASKWLWKTK